jgi:hypothetical protein
MCPVDSNITCTRCMQHSTLTLYRVMKKASTSRKTKSPDKTLSGYIQVQTALISMIICLSTAVCKKTTLALSSAYNIIGIHVRVWYSPHPTRELVTDTSKMRRKYPTNAHILPSIRDVKDDGTSQLFLARSQHIRNHHPTKIRRKGIEQSSTMKMMTSVLPPVECGCFCRTIVSRQNEMPMLSQGVHRRRKESFVALATPGEPACVCVSLLVET